MNNGSNLSFKSWNPQTTIQFRNRIIKDRLKNGPKTLVAIDFDLTLAQIHIYDNAPLKNKIAELTREKQLAEKKMNLTTEEEKELHLAALATQAEALTPKWFWSREGCSVTKVSRFSKKTQGYKLIIVSKGYEPIITQLLKEGKLLHFFTRIYGNYRLKKIELLTQDNKKVF